MILCPLRRILKTVKVIRAYKVELDPTNKQRGALIAHCGAVRWAYNWALARKIEAFKKKEKIPKSFTNAKELRAVRSEVAPWLTKYSADVIDNNLAHADKAFDNFFRRCKEGKPKKGFPKFRTKRRAVESIKFGTDFSRGFGIEKDRVRLPKIGWLRLKERGYIPTNGVKFWGASVKRKADRWFIMVQVEFEIPDPQHQSKQTVGVDFGIKMLAVCSDGQTFENPKAYKKQLRRLKRLNRAVSRKEKGSRNRQKASGRVAKLHYRIANVRANALHQISHALTKTKSVVVIEDLNVSGMMKNHHLAQALSDAGFGELRHQLTYKGLWRGCDVRFADRWMPSSKTCSACGTVKESLKLSERIFKCECGFECDRDLNAAKNLAKLALLDNQENYRGSLGM